MLGHGVVTVAAEPFCNPEPVGWGGNGAGELNCEKLASMLNFDFRQHIPEQIEAIALATTADLVQP